MQKLASDNFQGRVKVCSRLYNLVFYCSLLFSNHTNRDLGCQRSFQTANGFTVILEKRTPNLHTLSLQKPFKIMLIFHASFV